jgi:hypothetical protein
MDLKIVSLRDLNKSLPLKKKIWKMILSEIKAGPIRGLGKVHVQNIL